MFEFLFKGLIRDKSRSVLPLIVVALGVSLSVFFVGYMQGMIGDMVDQNARFSTGHMKVMSREYVKNIAQRPLDLALLDADDLIADLQNDYPEVDWVKRINFGGILDVPDEEGQTKTQGMAGGIALDLSSNSSDEKRMKLGENLVEGTLPNGPYQMILGDGLAHRMKVKLGDKITYFGSTMDGAMSFQNFTLVGTVSFGTSVLDDRTFIVDIKDAEQILDMVDAAQEILGFLPNDVYDDDKINEIKESFNAKMSSDTDEYAPEMLALRDQGGMSYILDFAGVIAGFFTTLFVVAMSIVLWNTGLLGGLRRYTEFGIRIAMGESKKAIYKSLLVEALIIGVIGSVIGTVLGVILTYYLQEVGIDISDMVGQGSMLVSNVIRAKVVPQQLWIGFIPGVAATLLGALLSGRGIFKRQTSQLFNELGV
ncbi:FtsX-like permease family protein [Flammeovirga yaeyamensis]|uniref:FtsX-like permease family protein n=1 Tax=Flammeovirga yaeyamensis TaxID=367791 RepID=A0AAX1NA15_9BACT|nr:FtsX-like permease family protein [Flammeovirga yaeyamensis]MBB3699297.1 putative ABC transport system permease protein [Flammeovirga yaeyamensis]NMF35440.1 ABC transporter permease [Flammeovirga yaeyamensis]QWG04300.1 FtsX-like permease family protein [Flammeovirga yaeyamensis]